MTIKNLFNILPFIKIFNCGIQFHLPPENLTNYHLSTKFLIFCMVYTSINLKSYIFCDDMSNQMRWLYWESTEKATFYLNIYSLKHQMFINLGKYKQKRKYTITSSELLTIPKSDLYFKNSDTNIFSRFKKTFFENRVDFDQLSDTGLWLFSDAINCQLSFSCWTNFRDKHG